MRKLFLLSSLVLFFFSAFSQTPKPKEILEKMLNACEAIKTAKFTLKSFERLTNGVMSESVMLVKYEAEPKKVYLFCVNPNAGTEVLYRHGWINDKLFINPSGFPFVNMKLSPYSSLVRKDTHHTIHQIGFDYISSMIRFYLNMYGENFYKYVSIIDTIKWENHTCIQLSYDFTEFDTRPYTVSTGETVTTIGAKLHLNDYSILLMNPGISDYDHVHPGQVIKVPNFYNRRVDFYIDKVTWLPLVQEVYDKKGLYERYELKSFIFNPKFESDEFTPTFKDYTY